MCAFAKIYNKAQHLTIIFYIMIPSSPLYQIGGKRVSFCVAFLMLLALFLIPVKTFARYEIIDEMRYNIIDDYAFSYCGIKELTVQWQDPIVINKNVFDGINLSKSTLCVPVGSRTQYENSLGWNNFGNIIEQ